MEKLIQDVQHLASEITDGEKKFRKAPSVVTALEIFVDNAIRGLCFTLKRQSVNFCYGAENTVILASCMLSSCCRRARKSA
ncbi:LL-diaminopimelate aminotransferase [Frankliniella fusca]|uniref:LL-diaminopimelate aminotransferase n=1 Tax=Frankliniella fusca TaxID=407009 RepID=A0AAE1HIZ4_9NEOP|nr:LL-diaminopimelate aminotransferase [Frankliniella fusca]